MIGSTSGLRAVGNGFIANYSPPEQRTENLAVAQVLGHPFPRLARGHSLLDYGHSIAADLTLCCSSAWVRAGLEAVCMASDSCFPYGIWSGM